LPIQIVKNQFVLDKLDQYQLQNGDSKKQLSASALDTYISCPFQFYLKYLAGIKEPEEVEEEFSPVDIGIVIHSTMEYLYKNNIERKGINRIEKQDFRSIFENVDEQLLKAFADLSGIEDVNNVEFSGNLLIIKEVITKYIQYILKFDESRVPLEIIQLEDSEAYQSSIEIDSEGKKVHIAIKGIIDRIDKIGDTIYIIDYKTGKADKEFKTIEELFIKDNDKRKKAIMQIMFYGLLLKDRTEFRKSGISPLVYDVKNMYSHSYDPSVIYKNDKIKQNLDERLFEEIMPDYQNSIKMILEEMFNPEIPFTQTEIEENCKYCKYKVICSKE
jgi:ATP-dependent helicase/DNAse subunit B